MLRRQLQFLAGVVLISLAVVGQARADMGPGFDPPRFVITLTFRGGEPAGDFKAILLVNDLAQNDLASSTEQVEDNQFIASLAARLAQERNGSRWSCCTHPERIHHVFGESIYYRPVPPGRFPRSVRLAVYDPKREQLFVTDPVETSRRNNSYIAVFDDDGTGTLTRTEVSWLRENYVLQMLAALAATIVIELAVVLVWIRLTTRRASVRRVVLIAIAGNLITVPAVWAAALAGKVYFDLQAAALIYIAAESAAVMLEAALYAWLGRFGIVNALWLSFTANCLSFLCGCCLVSFY